MNERKKSGIIIIGDEVLSGKTLDTNSNFISSHLIKRGVDVKEISIIPDNEDEIVQKILHFSKRFDYVFTTGGIGPTHDDITCKSIAKAFKRKLVQSFKAKKLLEKHYGIENLSSSRLKMSYFPEGYKLIQNPVSVAPGFNIKNVYVFPGVPKILEVMFYEFIDKLLQIKIFPQKVISTSLPESSISDFIENIQKANSDVKIGSYPYFKNQNFGVSLVIKSEDKKKLNKVSNEIFNYLLNNNGNPKLF